MRALPPIEVRTYGDAGAELVLLHGGPGAAGYLAPLARDLADVHRVFEPLQRVSGEVPLTVARHVADLADVAPPRAVHIGASWGAMLALSFAAAHPDRVRALVLIGCGTYDPDSRAAYQAAMAARQSAEDAARLARYRDQMDAVDPEDRARAFRSLAAVATRCQSVALLPLPDELAYVDAPGHAETWSDALRLQAEGIEPARFAGIDVPVLMLHGDEDPHPGDATRETLRRVLPQLTYVAFARCGHEPWRERYARDAFLSVLRAWLAALT